RHAEPEPCLVNLDNSTFEISKLAAFVAAAASAANPDAEEAKPAAVGTAFVESTFAKSPSISPYSLIKSRYLVTRLYASPVTSSLSKVNLSSVNVLSYSTVVLVYISSHVTNKLLYFTICTSSYR